MAYVAPSSRSLADLVSVDIWNQDVVDNMIAVRAGVVDFIHIVDQKSAGSNGGTFSSGTWRVRNLNTELVDTGGHASVGSNQITLAAGVYKIIATAPAYRVNAHRLRLWNDSDSAVIDLWASVHYANSAGNDMTYAMLTGQFTIAAQKVLELQHQCQTTRNADGFGYPINGVFTVPEEFYASVMLQRIADA